MNPSLGRNFEALDPLEWLARLADHIPDAGKRRTRFYAHYANRVRGERLSQELGCQEHEQEQPKKRRCSRSWARLIAKVDANHAEVTAVTPSLTVKAGA
jgi:hypothetical protein